MGPGWDEVSPRRLRSCTVRNPEPFRQLKDCPIRVGRPLIAIGTYLKFMCCFHMMIDNASFYWMFISATPKKKRTDQ